MKSISDCAFDILKLHFNLVLGFAKVCIYS